MQVSRLVRDSLRERALRFNVILDDVSITHVNFGKEFTQAVEAKQIGTFSLMFRYKKPKKKKASLSHSWGERKSEYLINLGFLLSRAQQPNRRRSVPRSSSTGPRWRSSP
jgi:hypothetical protein